MIKNFRLLLTLFVCINFTSIICFSQKAILNNKLPLSIYIQTSEDFGKYGLSDNELFEDVELKLRRANPYNQNNSSNRLNILINTVDIDSVIAYSIIVENKRKFLVKNTKMDKRYLPHFIQQRLLAHEALKILEPSRV